ncbi:hypothetical protein B484DRAFT_324250 [Ochromonadaceae sp. CCMP2298]|nr:hypothetical protein B484DRAFT_324250 [Ochromonadaceae sp. CCMP2298]
MSAAAEEDRLSALLRRVEAAEQRVAKLEEQASDPVQRVKTDLRRCKVFSAQFRTMPSTYYDLSLDQRACLLNCTMAQLCKSIIFENTAHDATVVDPVTNPKFVCVITQYIAKINTLALRTLMHEMRSPDLRLSKNKFNFRLAADSDSLALSGFAHNAVSPFGLLQHVPVIVCRQCTLVRPCILYLGGGHADVKLAIPAADLVRAKNAVVGDVTEAR